MIPIVLVSSFTFLGALLAASGADSTTTTLAVIAFMAIGVPLALGERSTEPAPRAAARRRATR